MGFRYIRFLIQFFNYLDMVENRNTCRKQYIFLIVGSVAQQTTTETAPSNAGNKHNILKIS